MAAREHTAITSMQKEFEDHLEKRSPFRFRPSIEASGVVAKLTKELEKKRQTGKLTEQEAIWLASIDKLQEEIIKFNQGLAELVTAAPANNNVYNPKDRSLVEQTEPKMPQIIPTISEKQADKIIKDLGEQFEEKVLKKLKDRPSAGGDFSEKDFAPSISTLGHGRRLEDYVSILKAERPDRPFMDEDSKMDLSKIKRKIKTKT